MTPGSVVVVGAGMAGLSAAHRLLEQARRDRHPLELTVLEAAPGAGGHVGTVREDGFVVESGPNGFLSGRPAMESLIHELGLGPSVIEASPAARRRFVLRDGRLRRLPTSPLTLLTSDALSRRGRLRLLLEPLRPRSATDAEETVFQFACRRLGAEAAETLVDAVVAGTSAGDSTTLSVEAAFPDLVEMERAHGSLTRAMWVRRRTGMRAPRLHSLAEGMGALVESIAARLGPALRIGSPVARIGRGAAGWRVELQDGTTVRADRVVVATSAWQAAPLLAGCDTELARTLLETPAAGIAVIALAYRESDLDRPLDGYGYLVRRGERRTTIGVLWESSLFPGRAPAGFVLLRAMLGGMRDPAAVTLAEPELVDRAVAEAAEVLGIRRAPQRAWVFRRPCAIAQYTLGHRRRVHRVRAAAAALPGLELCGTSFDGISLTAAVASGADAAARTWNS